MIEASDTGHSLTKSAAASNSSDFSMGICIWAVTGQYCPVEGRSDPFSQCGNALTESLRAFVFYCVAPDQIKLTANINPHPLSFLIAQVP